ncbi:MAG: ABC transporter ATP-binding protein [Alkalispirochaeta sp.]
MTPKERRRLLVLSLGIVVLGITEVAGVGIIGPFISVATNPEIIHTNQYLQFVYETLAFESETSFVFFVGIVALIVIIVRNVVAVLVRYAEIRFGQMRNHSISTRLLARYLADPYIRFVDRNSSELGKNILSEVGSVIRGYLIPLLESISKLVVVISIVTFLVIVEPRMALILASILVLVHGTVYLITRGPLFRVGKLRLEANRQRYRVISEVFGGIKDTKLMGKESVFLSEFKTPSKNLARYRALKELFGAVPKYVLDTLVFTAIILVVLFYISGSNDLAGAVSIAGVYALAGYRLMPALDKLYKNLAKVRGSQPAVDLVYEQLVGGDPEPHLVPKKAPPRMPFERTIVLDNVSFSYPNSDTAVISGQTLQIDHNTTVGFVGPTGCGKTTTVDIILGLLTPQSGSLQIDGTVVTSENLRNWQANLGYVPQHIYLSDDSIARNIAFGVPPKDIDRDQVRAAAAIANLDSLIENELPGGYDTVVGERGVRLSGGQRQRIGIARAMYHQPSVLVLDEATSALDNVTEAQVMAAIDNLAHKKTIIIIAHRISTVMKCDVIFVLDKGRIIAQGNYDHLLRTSPEFVRLIEASG